MLRIATSKRLSNGAQGWAAMLIMTLSALAPPIMTGGELDTLRTFERRTAGTYYRSPGILAQAARFDLAAPAHIREIVIWLGGMTDSGSAVVTLRDNEGGLPAPLLSTSIGVEYTIRKTRPGTESVVIQLDDVFLDEPQFFVVVTNLSSGVVLISDQSEKEPRCADVKERWMSQAIQLNDGRWYNGRYGYAIEVRVEYPKVTPPTYLANLAADLGFPDAISTSRSIAWGDYNSDGWQDVAVGGRLYRNLDGARFEDVTERSGLESPAPLAAHVFLDVDNDRDLDLLFLLDAVSPTDRAILYVNDGHGAYRARPVPVSVPRFPTSVAVADADGDGRLDVLIVGRDSLQDDNVVTSLVNAGAQGFVDMSEPFRGVADAIGSQWVDLDGDGDLDLYVTATSPSSSRRFINGGGGTFSEAIADAVNAPDSTAFFRVPGDWADVDADGTLDHLQPTTIELRTYSDIDDMPAAWKGFSERYRHWTGGATWADVDNDGRLDALLTSSCDCSFATLLMQESAGRFQDRSFEYGLFRVPAGTDAVWVDYDNDGKLDLATFVAGRFALFRNTAHHAGHGLAIDLSGSPEPARSIGARVTLAGRFGSQERNVGSGRGWLMQGPSIAHFGLGDGQPDSAVIEWTGGDGSISVVAPVVPIHRMFAPVTQQPASARARSELSLHISPNPFRSRLRIDYMLFSSTRLVIEIFAPDGRLVARLMDTEQAAGPHSVDWIPEDAAGRRLPAGSYTYRIDFGGRTVTGRAVLID